MITPHLSALQHLISTSALTPPTKYRSRAFATNKSVTLALALALGAVTLQPALAQDAFVIEDGELIDAPQVLDDDGDSLIIEDGGTLSVTDKDAVTAAGNDVVITNDGTIETDGDIASGIYSDGENAVIQNNGTISTLGSDANGIRSEGANATISNSGTILTVEGDASGIFSSGANATIFNSGTISTTDGGAGGIFSRGVNATISNSGTISTLGSNADGILSTGDNATLSNSGTISTSGGSAVGVLSRGANATISNSGTISTLGSNADGIVSSGDNAVIQNEGNILTTGDEAVGIVSRGVNATISNSGTISTSGRNAFGIASQGADVTIFNSGTISTGGEFSSAIFSNGTNASIFNSGTISTTGSNTFAIASEGANASIFNSGDIFMSGDNAIGIDSIGTGAVIRNSGLIFATGDRSVGIAVSDANARVFNDGTIRATGLGSFAVNLFGQDSSLTNSGQLFGGEDGDSDTGLGFAILGGEGSQTVNLRGGSQIFGRIDLGAGEDTLNIYSGASARLTFDGVETVNFGDGVAAFELENGVVMTVDTTVPFALNGAVSALANNAHRNIYGRLSDPGTSEGWVSLFGQWGSFGEEGAQLAYSHDFGGVMAGFDRDFGANRLGVVAGLSQGQIATDVQSSQSDVETFFAGAYVQFPTGTWNLKASVLAGTEEYDSERLVVDNLRGAQTATATFDNNFVSASLNAQAPTFDIGGLQVRPSAAVTYTASSFGEYTEIGAVDAETGTDSNLTMGSRTAHTLDARAQLEIDRDIGPLDATFRFGIDGQVKREDDIIVSLADGTSLAIAPGNNSTLGGFVGVRATLAQSDQLRLVGDVEYQFAKGDNQAVAASLSVNFSF